MSAYRSNRQSFQKVLRAKEKTDAFLADVNAQIDRLTSPYLNAALKSFLRQLDAYEMKQINLLTWLRFLKQAALRHLEIDFDDPFYQKDWPMLIRIYRLQEIESSLDRVLIETERAAFLKYLQDSKLPRTLIKKVDSILDFPLGRANSFSTFQNGEPVHTVGKMLEHLPKDFSFKPYSHLKLYLQFMIFQSEMKAPALFDEMSSLQEKILQKIAKSEKEKRLLDLFKNYGLLKKLFALELTFNEYETLAARKSDLQPSQMIQRFEGINTDNRVRNVQFTHLDDIDHLYELAVSFYQGAHQRDTLMANRVLEKLTELKLDKAVLVTGGFHSQGMRQFFEKRGFSYLLVSPRISNASDDQAYHFAMLDGNQEIETSQIENFLDLHFRPVIVDLGLGHFNHFRGVVRTILRETLSPRERMGLDWKLLDQQYGIRFRPPIKPGRSELRDDLSVREDKSWMYLTTEQKQEYIENVQSLIHRNPGLVILLRFLNRVEHLSYARTAEGQEAWISTRSHEMRTATEAVKIANEMRIPEQDLTTLAFGMTIHDIGKAKINPTVLMSKERFGPDDPRRRHLEEHVDFGVQMFYETLEASRKGIGLEAGGIRLKKSQSPLVNEQILTHLLKHKHLIDRPALREILQNNRILGGVEKIIASHHQFLDGSGYGVPIRSTDTLSLIASLADIYDAFTAQRSYKQGMPLEKVRDIFEKEYRGEKIDSEIVDAWLRVHDFRKSGIFTKILRFPILRSLRESRAVSFLTGAAVMFAFSTTLSFLASSNYGQTIPLERSIRDKQETAAARAEVRAAPAAIGDWNRLSDFFEHSLRSDRPYKVKVLDNVLSLTSKDFSALPEKLGFDSKAQYGLFIEYEGFNVKEIQVQPLPQGELKQYLIGAYSGVYGRSDIIEEIPVHGDTGTLEENYPQLRALGIPEKELPKLNVILEHEKGEVHIMFHHATYEAFSVYNGHYLFSAIVQTPEETKDYFFLYDIKNKNLSHIQFNGRNFLHNLGVYLPDSEAEDLKTVVAADIDKQDRFYLYNAMTGQPISIDEKPYFQLKKHVPGESDYGTDKRNNQTIFVLTDPSGQEFRFDAQGKRVTERRAEVRAKRRLSERFNQREEKMRAEKGYLAYEAAQFVDFYDAVKQHFGDRPVLILENVRLGRTALAPVRRVLETKGARVISTYASSSEMDEEPHIVNPDLLRESDLSYLLMEKPLVFVVDNSNSLDSESRPEADVPHYAAAWYGFRNYFFVLNEALGVPVSPKEFFIDEYVLLELRLHRDDEALKDKVKPLKSRDYSSSYELRFWAPTAVPLDVRPHYAQSTKESIVPPIVKPEELKGSKVVIVNLGLTHEDIVAKAQAGDKRARMALEEAGSIQHTAGYFDDYGKYYEPLPADFVEEVENLYLNLTKDVARAEVRRESPQHLFQKGNKFFDGDLRTAQDRTQRSWLHSFGAVHGHNGPSARVNGVTENSMTSGLPKEDETRFLKGSDDTSTRNLGKKRHQTETGRSLIKTWRPTSFLWSSLRDQRYNLMAFLILESASLIVSPWLAHPGREGTYTLYPPSDSSSITTLYLIASPLLFLLENYFIYNTRLLHRQTNRQSNVPREISQAYEQIANHIYRLFRMSAGSYVAILRGALPGLSDGDQKLGIGRAEVRAARKPRPIERRLEEVLEKAGDSKTLSGAFKKLVRRRFVSAQQDVRRSRYFEAGQKIIQLAHHRNNTDWYVQTAFWILGMALEYRSIPDELRVWYNTKFKSTDERFSELKKLLRKLYRVSFPEVLNQLSQAPKGEIQDIPRHSATFAEILQRALKSPVLETFVMEGLGLKAVEEDTSAGREVNRLKGKSYRFGGRRGWLPLLHHFAMRASKSRRAEVRSGLNEFEKWKLHEIVKRIADFRTRYSKKIRDDLDFLPRWIGQWTRAGRELQGWRELGYFRSPEIDKDWSLASLAEKLNSWEYFVKLMIEVFKNPPTPFDTDPSSAGTLLPLLIQIGDFNYAGFLLELSKELPPPPPSRAEVRRKSSDKLSVVSSKSEAERQKLTTYHLPLTTDSRRAELRIAQNVADLVTDGIYPIFVGEYLIVLMMKNKDFRDRILGKTKEFEVSEQTLNKVEGEVGAFDHKGLVDLLKTGSNTFAPVAIPVTSELSPDALHKVLQDFHKLLKRHPKKILAIAYDGEMPEGFQEQMYSEFDQRVIIFKGKEELFASVFTSNYSRSSDFNILTPAGRTNREMANLFRNRAATLAGEPLSVSRLKGLSLVALRDASIFGEALLGVDKQFIDEPNEIPATDKLFAQLILLVPDAHLSVDELEKQPKSEIRMQRIGNSLRMFFNSAFLERIQVMAQAARRILAAA